MFNYHFSIEVGLVIVKLEQLSDVWKRTKHNRNAISKPAMGNTSWPYSTT